jgi:hypothetical protein
LGSAGGKTLFAYTFELKNVLGDGCFEALCDMRFILVRDAHLYFKNPVARRANEMVMMLVFGLATEEKHGLAVIPVHTIEQAALQ